MALSGQKVHRLLSDVGTRVLSEVGQPGESRNLRSGNGGANGRLDRFQFPGASESGMSRDHLVRKGHGLNWGDGDRMGGDTFVDGR